MIPNHESKTSFNSDRTALYLSTHPIRFCHDRPHRLIGSALGRASLLHGFDAGMTRSRRGGLWERLEAGDLRNVGFTEFRRPIEAFGFELRRVSGSHHIYRHSLVPRPLSLQPREREAKPYQIRQFLEMVKEYSLTMEHRR